MNLWGITVKPSPWWLAQGEILLVHSAQQARINTSDSGYFSQNKEELRAQRLQGPSRTPCKYFLTHWSYRLSMYCSLVWCFYWCSIIKKECVKQICRLRFIKHNVSDNDGAPFLTQLPPSPQINPESGSCFCITYSKQRWCRDMRVARWAPPPCPNSAAQRLFYRSPSRCLTMLITSLGLTCSALWASLSWTIQALTSEQSGDPRQISPACSLIDWWC